MGSLPCHCSSVVFTEVNDLYGRVSKIYIFFCSLSSLKINIKEETNVISNIYINLCFKVYLHTKYNDK